MSYSIRAPHTATTPVKSSYSAGKGRHTRPKSQSVKGSSFRDALKKTANSIASGEKLIDRAIRSASRGQGMKPEQLIALQAGVFRYTQELELASKLVEKTTGAIRQTLQSQQ